MCLLVFLLIAMLNFLYVINNNSWYNLKLNLINDYIRDAHYKNTI